MHRLLSLLLVVVALPSTSACFHITTKVPGVIDMRSDGADMPTDTKPLTLGRDVSRTGVEAILMGDGTQQSGARVTVADRKFWAVGLVPLVNASTSEEIQAAVGTGTLRRVKVGESETVIDVAMYLGGSFVTSFVGLSGIWALFMPPLTASFEGERIAADGGAVAAAPSTPAP
jgi:hypothetical protein